MGPKRKLKNKVMPFVIFPFPKRTKREVDNYIGDNKDELDDFIADEDEDNYDEDYDEYGDEYDDEYDDEYEDEDKDDEDDDSSEDESIDLESYRRRSSNKKNKATIKSTKWIDDEFEKETNEEFIKNNVRLKMKVNLEKLWNGDDLTDDEKEIITNNLENIGIIVFNKIYEENINKKLSKILDRYNITIEKMENVKYKDKKDNELHEKILKHCSRIQRRFKEEVIDAKRKSDFDVNEFITNNYYDKIYDDRMIDKFNERYKSIDIDMDTKRHFKDLNTEDKKKYYDKMEEILENSTDTKSLYLDTLDREGLDDESKLVILKKIKECEKTDSHDTSKLETWLQKIKEIPFGNVKTMQVTKNDPSKNIEKFLENAKKCMDESIYGQEKVKNELMRIIGKFVMNNCETGNVIALEGPPGIGKTEIAKNSLSKALGIPCAFVPLGGLTDSSYLHGHDYTYTGSDYGKIIDILRQTKHMNPIIFFDELDKVSGGPKGDEIMNILMQITDPTQSDKFQDKYFRGINFDLSKCLMIFSFNDRSNISNILLNRMNIITIPSLKTGEKALIAKNFLIPKIMKESQIDSFNMNISDKLIKHIVESYTYEGGVRKLKDRLNEIILEINLRKLMKRKIGNKNIGSLVTLTKDIIDKDLLKERHTFDHEKRHKKNKVGLANGMWANSMGVGGLTPIQCSWIPSDKKLGLELTGLQGQTMKESMSVARTVAWKLLPEELKLKLSSEWDETSDLNKGKSNLYGVHIHVPDGGTSKDGPSAGTTITTAMVSLFSGIKCKCDVSMTGEIDMTGNAKAIGGLDDKLYGVKREGIRLALYPEENQKDVDEILRNYPDLVDDKFQVKSYKNIYESLHYILEHQLEWNEV